MFLFYKNVLIKSPQCEVWKCFTKFVVENVEKVCCNVCKTVLTGSSKVSTGHLTRHANFVCPYHLTHVKQQLLDAN